MSEPDKSFDEVYDEYQENIAKSQNEREKAQYFIEFIRYLPNLDDDLSDSVGYPTDIRPELEEYLSATEQRKDRSLDEFTDPEDKESEKETVFVDVSGRLDARVGNLVIEFKDDLQADLSDAEDQLQKYTYLLNVDEGIDEDLLCLATDGKTFITYETLFSEPVESDSDVQLSQLTRLDTRTANTEQVKRWLASLFSERVYPLVEELDTVFGVDSDTFEECIEILEDAYQTSPQAEVHKDEWADYLTYAQGTSPEEEVELFLRHTYLASFAKLMSYLVFMRGSMPSNEDAIDVISGEHTAPFPDNLFEKDLFAWIGKTEYAEDLTEILIDKLLGFNLGQVDQDVFKKLYQDMVSYEVRHDLGEYYTPDWLAEYIVRKKLELPSEDRVLDPGCGSGTFLVEAIQYKRYQSTQQPTELVSRIPEEVVGIDIHPLAVMVAKANYVAAIQDLLPYRREKIQIPIYLADSVLFEEGLQQPDMDIYGTEIRGPIEISGEEYYLPEKAIENPDKLDRALDIIPESLDEEEGFKNRLKNEVPEFEDITGALNRIRQGVARAERDDRDSIHVFILKNFYRPMYLSDNGSFDALIGNPPWLSYRYMGDRQQELVKEIFQDYNLYPGTSVGQMELATLFVCRCMDLYLRDNGKLGYVMPRAIFGAAQHEPFRRGESNINFDIDIVLDLSDVGPLFNVPACAIIAEKGPSLTYPIRKETFSGEFPQKDLSWNEAEGLVTIEEGEINLNYGDITSWDDIPDLKRSDYFTKFHQGANLYPRQFVYVELQSEAEQFGFSEEQPPVRTEEDIQKFAKEPYKGIYLEGNVGSEFIYGSLLNRDLVPFTLRRYRAAVIPAVPEASGHEMLNSDQAAAGGHTGLANWLNEVSEHYQPRDGRETFIDQLEYELGSRQGVSGQSSDIRYRVLYPTSGTHLAAAVVDTMDVPDAHDDFNLTGLIVDHKMHYYETNDVNEAYFLSGILNSNELNESIKNLQSRGDFGERDIYRVPLEFPIPTFDPEKDSHQRLAELSRKAESAAGPALDKAESEYTATWKIREVVREEIDDILDEIDNLVRDLIAVE